MAYVKKIQWLSEEAKEAEIYIHINKDNELICFAQPCGLKIGDQINELFSLNTISVQKKQEEEYGIISMHNNKYLLSGRVKHIKPASIEVYDVVVRCDDLPGDIHIGEYVEFVCERLDI